MMWVTLGAAEEESVYMKDVEVLLVERFPERGVVDVGGDGEEMDLDLGLAASSRLRWVR